MVARADAMVLASFPRGRRLIWCHEFLVAAPGTVADLGCGTGNTTRLLAQRWPDAPITGVDNYSDMLALAQSEPGSDASAIRWQQLEPGRGQGMGQGHVAQAVSRCTRRAVEVSVRRGLHVAPASALSTAIQRPDLTAISTFVHQRAQGRVTRRLRRGALSRPAQRSAEP